MASAGWQVGETGERRGTANERGELGSRVEPHPALHCALLPGEKGGDDSEGREDDVERDAEMGQSVGGAAPAIVVSSNEQGVPDSR